MNKYQQFLEIARKYSTLEDEIKNEFAEFFKDAFKNTQVMIHENIRIERYSDMDGNIHLRMVIPYSIGEEGFLVTRMKDIIDEIDRRYDIGMSPLDVDKMGSTLTFGDGVSGINKSNANRIAWFDLIPVEGSESVNETIDTVNTDDSYEKEVKETSSVKDAIFETPNTPFYECRDFLRKNGLPLNVLITTPYLSNGDISIYINNRRYEKFLYYGDLLKYREAGYLQRDNLLEGFIVDYFGDEITKASNTYLPKTDYSQYVIPEDTIIESAQILLGCFHQCLLTGTVNGEHKEYLLEYSDILAFYEVNKNGERTYRVTPEQLLVKYMLEHEVEPVYDDEEDVVETSPSIELEKEDNIVTNIWANDYDNFVIQEHSTEELFCIPEDFDSRLPFTEAEICVAKNRRDEKYVIRMWVPEKGFYHSNLSDEDISLYLERDETGAFTRKITPAMLAYVYFKDLLKNWEIKDDGILEEIGSALEWEPGVEPVFTYDPEGDKKFNDSLDVLVRNPKVVCYNNKYYLDTNICSQRRTVELRQDDVQSLLEKDADGNYRKNILPKDMVFRYFGHELYNITCNNEIERQELLVHCSEDRNPQRHWREPYEHTEMLPEHYLDYSDLAPHEGYEIGSASVFYNGSRYWISVHISGGVFKRKKYAILKHGKTEFFTLSDDDVANYLERDHDGKFTRRVTADQLAWKYSRSRINWMEDIIRMQDANIPATIIEKVVPVSESELKNYLKDFSMQRNKWIPVSFIDKKKRDIIVGKFKDGCSLSQIRKHFKFTDYSLVYSILKRDFDSDNPPLPDDIGLSEDLLKSVCVKQSSDLILEKTNYE